MRESPSTYVARIVRPQTTSAVLEKMCLPQKMNTDASVAATAPIRPRRTANQTTMNASITTLIPRRNSRAQAERALEPRRTHGSEQAEEAHRTLRNQRGDYDGG